LTIDRGGILETRGFRMESATTTLELPVTEDWVPGVRLAVVLAGHTEEGPDHAVGSTDLTVPPRSRTLTVRTDPVETEVRPGAETRVAVRVTGADGAPVPDAEVAVILADEAVLALLGQERADPVAWFYPERPPATTALHSRQYVPGLALPEDPRSPWANRGTNENTFLLDGSHPTDPVHGTFSVNFDFRRSRSTRARRPLRRRRRWSRCAPTCGRSRRS
jgi:hypothetical protein